MSQTFLKRNPSGIPSQRLVKASQHPVITESFPPHLAPTSPIPVSDTYADGTPEDNNMNVAQLKESAGASLGEEFESYTLTIMGSRRSHFSFTALDELKKELTQHLSSAEIGRGILRQLTTFVKKKINENGYFENKWQYFSACAYPFE